MLNTRVTPLQNMRALGSLALAAIIAITPSQSLSAQGTMAATSAVVPRADSASIPFEYADARLFVPVRATGGRGAVRWFILDTGAQPTVIDTRLADSLRLRVTGTRSASGAGVNTLREREAGPTTLHVGEVALSVQQPVVAPIDSLLARYSGRRAPGIIGSQFFLEHVVDIDFAHNFIHALRPSTFTYGGSGLVVPLSLENGVPMTSGTLIFRSGKRVPLRLLVDLGAKATLLLSEPFVAKNNLRAEFGRSVVEPLGSGIGGETHYGFVRLPRIEVATTEAAVVSLDSVIVGLSVGGTLRATWYDGLLGADFLRRFRVILDYSRQRMILEPSSPFDISSEFDMSGAFLAASGPLFEHFTVTSVVPGSPAAAAGLEAGDEVVGVDGKASSAFNLSALRDVLRSGNGRMLEVSLMRAGKPRRALLHLRRMI